MSVQKRVFTVDWDGSVIPSTAGAKTLSGKKGELALGRPGDVLERAYGPVSHAVGNLSSYTEFGRYVDGKGILVNPGDCAGVSSRLDTVVGLNAGEAGTFLVSGACCVLGSEVSSVQAGMRVTYLDERYVAGTSLATDVFEIAVDGFAGSYVPPSREAVKAALSGISETDPTVTTDDIATAVQVVVTVPTAGKTLNQLNYLLGGPASVTTIAQLLAYFKA